jgi:hypothetical protein
LKTLRAPRRWNEPLLGETIGQMQNDGGRFEDPGALLVLEDRHMAERMSRKVLGRARLRSLEPDQRVGYTQLLEHPART